MAYTLPREYLNDEFDRSVDEMVTHFRLNGTAAARVLVPGDYTFSETFTDIQYEISNSNTLSVLKIDGKRLASIIMSAKPASTRPIIVVFDLRLQFDRLVPVDTWGTSGIVIKTTLAWDYVYMHSGKRNTF